MLVKHHLSVFLSVCLSIYHLLSPSFCSVSKYRLSDCYLLRTVLGAGNTVVNNKEILSVKDFRVEQG